MRTNVVIDDQRMANALKATGLSTKKEAVEQESQKGLNTLEQYQLFDIGMADKCADNYRKLRRKGLTTRKAAYVIIVAYCIEKRLSLVLYQ